MTEPELITAARDGEADEVDRLLSQGADVNAQDEQGWTALNWAAGRGDLETVGRLLTRGADPTLTGRDNRTPLMIAKAAGHAEVSGVLTEAEKKAGVWEDPRLTRPYCRAYHLRDLRAYGAWREARKDGSEEKEGDDGTELSDDDVVYLHQDFTVTRSMWHGENIVYDDVTPDWRIFCEKDLDFAIPEDLL